MENEALEVVEEKKPLLTNNYIRMESALRESMLDDIGRGTFPYLRIVYSRESEQ